MKKMRETVMRLSEKLRERGEVSKLKLCIINLISDMYCTVLPIIIEDVPFGGVSKSSVAGDGKRRHDHQRGQNRDVRHL